MIKVYDLYNHLNLFGVHASVYLKISYPAPVISWAIKPIVWYDDYYKNEPLQYLLNL